VARVALKRGEKKPELEKGEGALSIGGGHYKNSSFMERKGKLILRTKQGREKHALKGENPVGL